jgi:DNA (cytosine-5)-methyltransferase 1
VKKTKGKAVPVLLDLFSGAGGSAVGYYRAGFNVIGVDIEPQPNFPPFCQFIQADAMKILEGPLDQYDAIHASPPCQAYSNALKHMASGYPELIAPVLERLQEIDIPWVVENVPGSPLITGDTLFGDHGVLLCGSMFGLRVQRHRLFQTSFPVMPPRYCDHSQVPMNPHNSASRKLWREKLSEDEFIERSWVDEMGLYWMGLREGREAIPPVYTQHIGYFLRRTI